MHEALVGAGFASRPERNHHRAHLSDFLDFVKEATFSDGVHHMARIILKESFRYFPENTIHVIANRLAFTGGRAAAYSFVVEKLSQNIAVASASFERAAIARNSVKTIFAVIGVMSQVAHSGAAADRLEKMHSRLYAMLERERLIGGYYLIESAVAPYLEMALYFDEADVHERESAHEKIARRL
jgi:hypothetical protein